MYTHTSTQDQEIDNLIYKLQGLKQKNHIMGSFKSGNDRGKSNFFY